MIKLRFSSRQIEYLVGIIATALIATGLFIYALQEPERAAVAQEMQLNTDLDEAMSLYAENCSVCHGLAGEGIGSTPALDNLALRQSDSSSLNKVIARGLYGTAMPAWSKDDGGPLGDYQIGELVTLIQYGDWGQVQDRVVNLGLAPLVPFTSEPDEEILENLAELGNGDLLAQGIRLYAQECVACHGSDGMGSAIAPALNDSGVRTKTEDELRRIILNGVAGTVMAPWENRLDDQDIDAIVALLTGWDQVPSGAIPAPERPVAVTEESLALGADLYANNCARCHGPEGQGTPRAPALNVKGFLTDIGDAAMEQIVAMGVPGTSMPAWGDRMTDAEIQAIVGFVRAWEPTAPDVADPARGGGPWWKSDGATTPGGGGRGGPPWMQNNSTSMQDAAEMPSGGSVSVVATQNKQVGQGQYPVVNVTENHSTGQGENYEEVSSAEHLSGGGGGPPWARNQAPVPWWQELDWRVFALLGAGLGFALFMVVFAWVSLRRLNQRI
jgi:mono/diheme cytochrome c family protein